MPTATQRVRMPSGLQRLATFSLSHQEPTPSNHVAVKTITQDSSELHQGPATHHMVTLISTTELRAEALRPTRPLPGL